MALSSGLLFWLGVAAALVGALVLLLAMGGRRRKEREREIAVRRLAALSETEGMIASRIEVLIASGRRIVLPAEAEAGQADLGLITALSDYRAETAKAQMELIEECRVLNEELTAAGLSLQETLEALGRTKLAVDDVYAAASSQRRDLMSARAGALGNRLQMMNTAVDQLALHAEAVRAQIQARRQDLLPLAG